MNNNIKGEILIRADGDGRTGLGHLVRCSALAQMLKDDFDIIFYSRFIPGSLAFELRRNGFNVVRITNEKDFLASITPDKIIIIDGYDFDTDYQRTIKYKDAKLICIDDLHDKEFMADLIINHTPGVKPKDYMAQPYTQYALGPEYVLLRPVFLEQAKKNRQVDKVETVLICFGGADPDGLTLKALITVSEFKKFNRIVVITGAAFNRKSEFDKILVSDPRISYRHNLSERQMVEALVDSDLAIVPSSGILFEALVAGCVVIAGMTTSNQKYLYESLRGTGLFIDANSFSNNELSKAISTALWDRPNSTKIIDGKSKERILKLTNQLYNELLITLRDVNKEDKDLTYGWASNQEIRRFSFNRHPISFKEHTEWFNRKINDPSCLYLIADYKGESIGSIRFDITEGEAVINYLLNPEYQGKGFGLVILKKGIERLMKEKLSSLNPLKILIGEVMKDNIPSIKSFNRLGFIAYDLGYKYRFEKLL
ncbi:MAG: UDP-2,4-diacetamido-2,4,6-trideoxy-beta-L-altropyranose hydrolase [Bacteroidales bacterium]|nr:UDP-2,4-diacetamido-2,4,6-trideoxy-beta-L-altropyranose hydrolase [Bacteroidales bacterium]